MREEGGRDNSEQEYETGAILLIKSTSLPLIQDHLVLSSAHHLVANSNKAMWAKLKRPSLVALSLPLTT